MFKYNTEKGEIFMFSRVEPNETFFLTFIYILTLNGFNVVFIRKITI